LIPYNNVYNGLFWKNGMKLTPFLAKESLYRFKTYENVEAA
jgi:hypothetical protein